MCFWVLELSSIFREDYFLLYLQKRREGSGKRQSVMLMAGTSHHSPVPRKNSSVFHFGCCHLWNHMPWRKESCFVRSSILRLNIGEWMTQACAWGSLRLLQQWTKPRGILESGYSQGFVLKRLEIQLGRRMQKQVLSCLFESMFQVFSGGFESCQTWLAVSASGGFCILVCNWFSPFL